jgi:RNA recognition motif-containing protein
MTTRRDVTRRADRDARRAMRLRALARGALAEALTRARFADEASHRASASATRASGRAIALRFLSTTTTNGDDDDDAGEDANATTTRATNDDEGDDATARDAETAKRRTRRRTAQTRARLEPSPRDAANVYVKNMPPGVDEDMLKRTFRKYGPILSAKALNPEGPWPGGLVRFVRAEHAEKAIAAASEGELGALDGAPGALVLRLAAKKPQEGEVEEMSPTPRRKSRKVIENLTSLVGDDGEPLDAEAAAEALERREAEIANRRKIRAEKLMDQKAKAREMSEARRAERVAAGRENVKFFVPRYKRRTDGGSVDDLKFDPSLLASTSSRRSKDGAMGMGIAQRRRAAPSTRRREKRGDAQDAKIQQALTERIRVARQLQAENKTYDYDRQEFDRKSLLLFHENLDVAHIIETPRLGSQERAQSDEEYVEANKEWLMQAAEVESEEEFEFLKKEAVEARAQQRDYERLMRKRAGLSPFRDNFLAERASLEAVVSDIDKDNVLREMSKMAVNTLDANPYWKYADKIRLLERLEREATVMSGVTAEDSSS